MKLDAVHLKTILSNSKREIHRADLLRWNTTSVQGKIKKGNGGDCQSFDGVKGSLIF
jgi:hypothetical protein